MIGRHEARVLASHARVATSVELQYRANFWAQVFNTTVTLVASLASIGIVFGHVDEVGGWSGDELLVALGVFFALGAIINGLMHASVARLVRDIKYGDFDYRLLKPVDAQAVAIGQQPDVWRVFDLLVGIALVAVGAARGGVADDADWVTALLALGLFACAVVIAASFWLLLSCITFWTREGEGILWSLDDMYDHLRWPVSIFPDGLRIALSTVFPLGLAVTVPAEALTGRLGAGSAFAALGLAVGLAIAARIVWHVAVRRYEGASA